MATKEQALLNELREGVWYCPYSTGGDFESFPEWFHRFQSGQRVWFDHSLGNPFETLNPMVKSGLLVVRIVDYGPLRFPIYKKRMELKHGDQRKDTSRTT